MLPATAASDCEKGGYLQVPRLWLFFSKMRVHHQRSSGLCLLSSLEDGGINEVSNLGG